MCDAQEGVLYPETVIHVGFAREGKYLTEFCGSFGSYGSSGQLAFARELGERHYLSRAALIGQFGFIIPIVEGASRFLRTTTFDSAKLDVKTENECNLPCLL